jgi:hypothetical protein
VADGIAIAAFEHKDTTGATQSVTQEFTVDRLRVRAQGGRRRPRLVPLCAAAGGPFIADDPGAARRPAVGPSPRPGIGTTAAGPPT